MESLTTLSPSTLPNSIGDNQSESQPSLGEKEEDIPLLKKQPIIPLSSGMEDGKSTTVPPVPPISPDAGLPIEAITASSRAFERSVQKGLEMERAFERWVQEFLEMEWQPHLPNSVGDNQLDSQVALGGKEEGIPLLKKTEDEKSTTVPPVPPILPDAGFTPCNNSSNSDSDVDIYEPLLETQIQTTRDFIATIHRFIKYIRDAPSRTLHLDDAAKYLGVDKDSMYRVRSALEACSAVVQVTPDVVTWIAGAPTLEVIKIKRNLKIRKTFENVVRSLSDKTNGKNRKWRWLFLTEADIKDFVGYQNDIFMIVKYPCDINFTVPRPAQDADVRQRRYGIVYRCSQVEGMKRYIVSKLESHDVVNGYKTSRSYKGSSDDDAGLPKEEEGCKRGSSEAGLPKGGRRLQALEY